MAACDLTEIIRNASPYLATNLGGVENQRAFRAYAYALLAGNGTTVGALKNVVGGSASTALGKLGAANPDQVIAAEISMVLAAATRAGVSVPSTLTGKINIGRYLYEVDDATVDKVRILQLCAVLSALIP